MILVEKKFDIPRMDERVANVAPILFLMEEAVRKNFDPKRREDRLTLAAAVLADCDYARALKAVRKERAK